MNTAFIMPYSIHPWQFGMLNLTEDGGNRVIKYADEIYQGVSALLPAGSHRYIPC